MAEFNRGGAVVEDDELDGLDTQLPNPRRKSSLRNKMHDIMIRWPFSVPKKNQRQAPYKSRSTTDSLKSSECSMVEIVLESNPPPRRQRSLQSYSSPPRRQCSLQSNPSPPRRQRSGTISVEQAGLSEVNKSMDTAPTYQDSSMDYLSDESRNEKSVNEDNERSENNEHIENNESDDDVDDWQDDPRYRCYTLNNERNENNEHIENNVSDDVDDWQDDPRYRCYTLNRRNEGMVDRIRQNVIPPGTKRYLHGVYSDTVDAFDQVWNVFTLQERDIDAVSTVITGAKKQYEDS
jgi:hypothetical protein